MLNVKRLVFIAIYCIAMFICGYLGCLLAHDNFDTYQIRAVVYEEADNTFVFETKSGDLWEYDKDNKTTGIHQGEGVVLTFDTLHTSDTHDDVILDVT